MEAKDGQCIDGAASEVPRCMKSDGVMETIGGGDVMPRGKENDRKKTNGVNANRRQEERAPGYGDKKVEGPDRPST